MSCNGWKEMKLGEIVQFNPRESIAKNQIAKKIAMEKLKPYNRTIEDYEYAEFKGGTKFRNGDTLLARITPCLENGKTAQVSILNEDEVGFGSTEYIVLREKPNKSVNNFIYYLSISPRFRDIAIKSMIGTSGRQRVQQDVLENTRIPLPELDEQKAIAATLSCLDDKIELNNRINRTLEEMAQAIFKNWFVDFEPFQDGEFEDSELGRIPKGWRVGTLDEITCKFATGLNPRKNFILGQGDNYYVTIKNMANNNVVLDSKCDRITDEAILKINKRSDLKKGDLLFSGIGTIGRVYMIDQTPKNWNISESVFTVRPNDLYTSELLYLLLLSERMQDYAQSSASGSVQKGIRMADLKKFKVLIPPIEIVHKVSDILRTIIDNIKSNHYQNGNLIQTRDTLLPKLMSGEIRVPTEEVQ